MIVNERRSVWLGALAMLLVFSGLVYGWSSLDAAWQREYVSDEDYKRYINESRYCILNYQGEYSNRSSGVVFDIIFSGVPVVGNSCKALHFVKDYEIVHIYDNIDELSAEGLFDEKKYEVFLDRISKYRQLHSEYYKKLSTFVGVKDKNL